MTTDNASLAERWRRSPTVQGAALGVVLGPIGMFLAYTLSARDKRETRLFGALRGCLAAAMTMVVVGGILLVATGSL